MRKLREGSRDYKIGQKVNDFTIDSERFIEGNRGYYWCKCICGNKKKIRVDWFIDGLVKSCGCNKNKYVSENNPRNTGSYLNENGDKQCLECLIVKKKEDYPINNREPDKLNRRCHVCRKNKWLMKKYNITLLEYYKMLELQNYKCACCEKSNKDVNNSRCNDGLFFVDHCHSTNQIRGLLCSNCNSGLGFFKDNITFLENAISYLNYHRSKNVN